MIFYGYTNGSCGTGAQPDNIIVFNESSDTSDFFQCDQSAACDYAVIRNYFDEDCTGDSYFDVPWIVGQCYSGVSTSLEYECAGDSIFTVISYSSETDCTGGSASANIDYDDYSETQSGCYEVRTLNT